MGVGVYECRMLNGERKYERTKGTAHTGKILIELNEQGWGMYTLGLKKVFNQLRLRETRGFRIGCGQRIGGFWMRKSKQGLSMKSTMLEGVGKKRGGVPRKIEDVMKVLSNEMGEGNRCIECG